MPHPVEVIEQQLSAYNVRDLEAFMAMYSPAITIMNQADGAITINGAEALRTAYGNLFASSPNLHCEIVKRMVIGNYVIDHEHVTGRGSAPPLNVVVIYEVHTGLIQRAWILRE